MIFPSDFEKKVGFHSVRTILIDSCISPLGEAYCRKMQFMTDFDSVTHALRLTAEMLALLSETSAMPAEGIHDVTAQLKQLRVEGSYLSATDLYRLRSTLDIISRLKSFLSDTDELGDLKAPLLNKEFQNLLTFGQIISLIDTVINKFGEVSDNASPELYEIRRSIASASASLSTVMRRVIDRAVADGVLDADTTPTVRDGRLVIPVSAGKKRSIPGIVHDESATGKTAYIEPASVVEASNRLRELREREKREIHRILVETAAAIRPHADEILSALSLLGKYDFIRAKALVARMFDAQMPVMQRNRQLEWYGARHPQLAISLSEHGKKVVPLDIRLDSDNRILIISGPNAGGKSVCLKTVGIVQYMLQCGMLPSVYSNSHMCVFSNLCIDIGDEQSIENDLSTYSSHLKNMKTFLRCASPTSLFLVDEMGSGTEPQIGGALAQAIISRFNDGRAMGIITTHYQNLKTFADATPGIINGAMLYDRQNMQPLFKLTIGTPGSSFALEIAHKIGLPTSVINLAKDIVGSDYVNMDKYLLDIARDRRYWQNKRQSIREKEAKLEATLDKYDAWLSNIKELRREILAEAKAKASELLADSNRRLERTIKEIRDAQADKERTKVLRRELDEYKKQLASQDEDNHLRLKDLPKAPRKTKSKTAEEKPLTQQPASIKVGSYVKMSKGGSAGKVLSISGNSAEVAFGAMRMRVPVKQLIQAAAPAVSASTQSSSISRATIEASRSRQLNFKQDIDLRGMRADEALQAVTYFLDDAVQFGVRRVRILHGTGTGALKLAIRRYLQAVPDVESFKDEDVRLGGAGITVVDLR